MFALLTFTLLGTAALLPTPERALTAAALQCCGRCLLLDCGEGTQTAARRQRVNVLGADAIALTHYHGDHIFGLPGLLQTMGSMERQSPLTLIGPGDIRRELAPILALVGWVPFPIRLIGLPPEGLPLSELHPGWPAGALLTAFPTEHRVVSQGYVFTLSRTGRFQPDRAEALGLSKPLWGRLQRGETVCVDGRAITPGEVLGPPRRGLKVVFSGDTAACASLTDAARGADLFLCEGTYGDDAMLDAARRHGHMTFAQAAGTARDAGVKRLWLAHFSQMMENPSDFLPAADRIFPGTVIAEDGQRAVLTFPDEDAPEPADACPQSPFTQGGET